MHFRCQGSLAGHAFYGVLDLASTTDITSLVLMFPPIKEQMKLVLKEQGTHSGHLALRWINISAPLQLVISKRPQKNAGTVTTIMALDKTISCGNDTCKSVYNNQELIFI